MSTTSSYDFDVPAEASDRSFSERSGRQRSRRVAQKAGIQPDHRFDYKDVSILKYFLTDRGKVIPRRISGLTAVQQRDLARAVRRARQIALLPFQKGNP